MNFNEFLSIYNKPQTVVTTATACSALFCYLIGPVADYLLHCSCSELKRFDAVVTNCLMICQHTVIIVFHYAFRFEKEKK